MVLFDTLQNRLRLRGQKYNLAALSHLLYIDLPHRHTAAAGYNLIFLFPYFLQQVCLLVAEICLAVQIEDLGNAHVVLFRDHFIHFHHIHRKGILQCIRNGALSDSHKSDQENIEPKQLMGLDPFAPVEDAVVNCHD